MKFFFLKKGGDESLCASPSTSSFCSFANFSQSQTGLIPKATMLLGKEGTDNSHRCSCLCRMMLGSEEKCHVQRRGNLQPDPRKWTCTFSGFDHCSSPIREQLSNVPWLLTRWNGQSTNNKPPAQVCPIEAAESSGDLAAWFSWILAGCEVQK